jgi:putative ABC transport system permease protein
MRAIGASNWSVLQIFMTEGIVIGLMGWAIGSLLAIPISQMLSGILGEMLFSNPLNFSFSFSGIVVWLVLSLLLAAIASFFPAWRATRVSVREVLAYE